MKYHVAVHVEVTVEVDALGHRPAADLAMSLIRRTTFPPGSIFLEVKPSASPAPPKSRHHRRHQHRRTQHELSFRLSRLSRRVLHGLQDPDPGASRRTLPAWAVHSRG